MTSYDPISCDFHDILEDAAVRRLRIEVAYRDQQGTERATIGKIKDITVEDQEEFLIMEDGLKLRLDQIQRVDQHQASDFGPDGLRNDAAQGTPERPLMQQPPRKAS